MLQVMMEVHKKTQGQRMHAKHHNKPTISISKGQHSQLQQPQALKQRHAEMLVANGNTHNTSFPDQKQVLQVLNASTSSSTGMS